MKVSRLNNLLRPNCVYRGIAVFFLLFTLADLTFSGFCCDEFTDLSPSAQTQSLADTMTLVDADDSNQQGKQHSQSGAMEEDCFCSAFIYCLYTRKILQASLSSSTNTRFDRPTFPLPGSTALTTLHDQRPADFSSIPYTSLRCIV